MPEQKWTVHVGLVWHGAWCHITHPADERRECCDLWDKQAVTRARTTATRSKDTQDTATLEAAIAETLASPDLLKVSVT